MKAIPILFESNISQLIKQRDIKKRIYIYIYIYIYIFIYKILYIDKISKRFW